MLIVCALGIFLIVSAVGFGTRAKRFAVIIDDLKVSFVSVSVESSYLLSLVVIQRSLGSELRLAPESDLPASKLFLPSSK